MGRRGAAARVAVVVAVCAAATAGGWVARRAGPARREGRARPLIGFSLDTLKEERWHHDRDLFIAAAGRLGADVLVQAANSDDARQIRDVEALLSRKVDALVVVPHDGAAMAKAVQLAHESGVPVIAYDRLILNSDLDFYITFDSVKIGRAQARFVVDALARKPSPLRLVRIHGAPNDNNSYLIKQGQDEVLAPLLKSGRVQIIHEDWAEGWKPENAKKIVNAAITKFGSRLDAVVAANDGTAGGAIQALREEGLAGKVVVTGEDAELAACQRIAAGTQSMTVFQPLKLIAGRAAEIAVKLARRQPVIVSDSSNNGRLDVPTLALDVVALTAANMDDVVVKGGYYAYDEVYRDVPAASRPPRP